MGVEMRRGARERKVDDGVDEWTRKWTGQEMCGSKRVE